MKFLKIIKYNKLEIIYLLKLQISNSVWSLSIKPTF